MKISLKQWLTGAAVLLMGTVAIAKLPGLSDEAKAKAAEASAKAAWSGKVEGYQLCKSQDKVAAYVKAPHAVDKAVKSSEKPASKDPKAPAPASGCVDPGPFIYPPVVVAAPAVPASAAPANVAPQKKP